MNELINRTAQYTQACTLGGLDQDLQLQARLSTKWSSINSFFFFNNLNISSAFCIHDTILSYNP